VVTERAGADHHKAFLLVSPSGKRLFCSAGEGPDLEVLRLCVQHNGGIPTLPRWGIEWSSPGSPVSHTGSKCASLPRKVPTAQPSTFGCVVTAYKPGASVPKIGAVTPRRNPRCERSRTVPAVKQKSLPSEAFLRCSRHVGWDR
jgi:hypothetical protein